MIVYLDKTTYQEFDAWLCNKAGKYKFNVSYNEIDSVDDLGDLDRIPKKAYPLRIFLSKIYANGIEYDQDGVFIIEKVGDRLKVCPKVFNERGRESFKPILEEIADDWPEAREKILREVFKTTIENPLHRTRGPNAGTLVDVKSAMICWLDGNKSINAACELEGIDDETMLRWIPNILDQLEDSKREDWIIKINSYGKGKYLGKYFPK